MGKKVEPESDNIVICYISNTPELRSKWITLTRIQKEWIISHLRHDLSVKKFKKLYKLLKRELKSGVDDDFLYMVLNSHKNPS